MRIYEYSKKSGVPSKELVEVLSKAGFDVKTHMSLISDEALAFLEKKAKMFQPFQNF